MYIKDNEIKEYIANNSNVARFSEWGNNQELTSADNETITAYVRDNISHKEQVKHFLLKYQTGHLNSIMQSERDKGTNNNKISDNLLKQLGYKYVESV